MVNAPECVPPRPQASPTEMSVAQRLYQYYHQIGQMARSTEPEHFTPANDQQVRPLHSPVQTTLPSFQAFLNTQRYPGELLVRPEATSSVRNAPLPADFGAAPLSAARLTPPPFRVEPSSRFSDWTEMTSSVGSSLSVNAGLPNTSSISPLNLAAFSPPRPGGFAHVGRRALRELDLERDREQPWSRTLVYEDVAQAGTAETGERIYRDGMIGDGRIADEWLGSPLRATEPPTR